jgi:hypothetical protein
MRQGLAHLSEAATEHSHSVIRATLRVHMHIHTMQPQQELQEHATSCEAFKSLVAMHIHRMRP